MPGSRYLTVMALALPALVLAGQVPWHLQGPRKVPVVLGVMSRCPDAILCESVFDEVLTKVGNKVDLSLTYVAKVDPTNRPFGVTCMHGDIECQGNIQQLCAATYHPQEQWWPFVQCQNAAGRYSVGDPELAQRCAVEAGIDWDGYAAGRCAVVGDEGAAEEGRGLLQASAVKTASLGIRKSCTIVLNGRQICIRDSTWYDCEGGHEPADFVRQIEEEYVKINA